MKKIFAIALMTVMFAAPLAFAEEAAKTEAAPAAATEKAPVKKAVKKHHKKKAMKNMTCVEKKSEKKAK